MKELGGGGVEGWRGSQPLCSLCFTGGGGGGGGAEPDPEASLAVKLASFHLPASPHPSLSLSTPPPHLSAFISASLPPSSSSSSSPLIPPPCQLHPRLPLPSPPSPPPQTLLPHLLHPHCSTHMIFLFLTHQKSEPLPPSHSALSPSRLAIMFCWSPWKQIQVGCPL